MPIGFHYIVEPKLQVPIQVELIFRAREVDGGVIFLHGLLSTTLS
jgi:hypothetical protein